MKTVYNPDCHNGDSYTKWGKTSVLIIQSLKQAVSCFLTILVVVRILTLNAKLIIVQDMLESCVMAYNCKY